MDDHELSSALKDVLESRGVLGQVQARLRAEVFKTLEDDSVPKPELCQENLLINELIREYLQFNNYNYTNSVLQAESGQPKEPLDKQFLAKQLHIPQTDSKNEIPLLYRMLAHFMHTPQSSHTPNPIDDKPTVHTSTKPSSQCVIEEPTYPDS